MHKQGQSIVEYCLIIVLVILGVVYMGPYVLRSINAHFKLWDDSAQDSFTENLAQAPINAIPVINGTCQCTQVKGNCGGPGLLCTAAYREVDYNCNIQGCETPSCQYDQTCCSTATPQNCGQATLPVHSTATTCPPGVPPGSTCYAPLPPTVSSSPCYFGQRMWGNQCGNTESDVCITDNTCPQPACQGYILFPNSTIYCKTGSSNPPTSGLNQNMPNAYVGNSPSNCSSNGSPCQVYCAPPYTLNATGNQCTLQFTVAANSCTASSNFTSTTCNAACQAGKCSCTTTQCKPATGGHCCSLTSHCNCYIQSNDESFTTCVNPTSAISSVFETPYGPTAPETVTPDVNGGCGNPGEPTQSCAISINN